MNEQNGFPFRFPVRQKLTTNGFGFVFVLLWWKRWLKVKTLCHHQRDCSCRCETTYLDWWERTKPGKRKKRVEFYDFNYFYLFGTTRSYYGFLFCSEFGFWKFFFVLPPVTSNDNVHGWELRQGVRIVNGCKWFVTICDILWIQNWRAWAIFSIPFPYNMGEGVTIYHFPLGLGFSSLMRFNAIVSIEYILQFIYYLWTLFYSIFFIK